jgi:hypothetical protein
MWYFIFFCSPKGHPVFALVERKKRNTDKTECTIVVEPRDRAENRIDMRKHENRIRATIDVQVTVVEPCRTFVILRAPRSITSPSA